MKNLIKNLQLGLLGIIIAGIIEFFMRHRANQSGQQASSKFHHWLSYVTIGIFILYTMYDTKQIMVAAKECQEKTVDYINQSLGIVLDALNIFQSLVNVQ